MKGRVRRWLISVDAGTEQAIVIADNAALNQTSAEFCLPIVTYTTVESDGEGESIDLLNRVI